MRPTNRRACRTLGLIAMVASSQSIPAAAADPTGRLTVDRTREHLLVLAPDGAVIATRDGDESTVVVDPELDAILGRPGAHVKLTHNHPRSRGLSGSDLYQLTRAGVDAIEAVGADGSRYEARRGPRFADGLGVISAQYCIALAEVERSLSRSKREADDDLDIHIEHLVTLAFHKAGIINYHFALSGDRMFAFVRYRPTLGPIAEVAASRLKEGMAKRVSAR